MSTSAKLIFLCGKVAAGKSTLARDLAIRENAVLLVQDDFLNTLFPGEITDIPDFVDRYTRLKNALTPHICVLLSNRISVVLDFAAATKTQRAWFRELIERTHVEHELHFVDAPDGVCKTQLRNRSRIFGSSVPKLRENNRPIVWTIPDICGSHGTITSRAPGSTSPLFTRFA